MSRFFCLANVGLVFFIFSGGLSTAAEPEGNPALRPPPESAQAAVTDYLQFRRNGKRHFEALRMVRERHGLTDDQINQAAHMAALSGYANDVTPPARDESKRKPATRADAISVPQHARQAAAGERD